MDNDFRLLIRKDIIQILDGDTKLGRIRGLEVSMPYLSTSDLIDLCVSFGLCQTSGGSRWQYLEELLQYLIPKGQCEELLRHIFALEQFHQLEGLGDLNYVSQVHNEICEAIIKKINEKLLLSKHELLHVNGRFFMREIGSSISLEVPQMKRIDIPYIQELPERCKDDLTKGDYDSVVTKSRTLIEEVLIYILEQHDIKNNAKGNIHKLYNQVKDLYSMHQNKEFDERVNSLIYGLERIIDSIADMRNLNSDSHGVGKARFALRKREARLVMNSAMTFCEYIISFD